VSRVFGLSMSLLARDDSGQSDSWNKPFMTVTRVAVMGYFWQTEVGSDPDSGDVTREVAKAAFLPPKSNSWQPKSFHGLEFVLGGETITWEIIGEPEPKFSMARGGTLHHYEVTIRRAA
jgi:hypothetical protein